MLDSETIKALATSTYKLTRSDERPNYDDIVLQNEELLAELAGIWEEHEEALRTLIINVINAPVADEIVYDAFPIEIVGNRHEMQGAEKVLHFLERYSIEHTKRRQAEADEKTKPETPQPVPVEDDEKSSL